MRLFLFLLENMFWSFLPWIIFFLFALVLKTKMIFKQKLRISNEQEAITWGGFILTYLSLGMSRYQLPHYIFVAFPFAAIITGDFIKRMTEVELLQKIRVRLTYFHLVLFVMILLTLTVLIIWPFEDIHLVMKVLVLIVVAGTIYWIIKNSKQNSFIIKSGLMLAIVINFFLNSCFYPSLLKYQAGSNAGCWMKEHQIDPHLTYTFQYTMWRSLHFYANGNVYSKDDVAMIHKGDFILTQKEKMHLLDEAGLHYDILYEGADYPVSKISLPFLNPKTRGDVLNHFYLIKII